MQAISGSYDSKKVRRALITLFPDKTLKEYDRTNPSSFTGRPMKASWSYDPEPEAEDDQHYTQSDWDDWESDVNSYYSSGTSTHYPHTDDDWSEDNNSDGDWDPDIFQAS